MVIEVDQIVPGNDVGPGPPDSLDPVEESSRVPAVVTKWPVETESRPVTTQVERRALAGESGPLQDPTPARRKFEQRPDHLGARRWADASDELLKNDDTPVGQRH